MLGKNYKSLTNLYMSILDVWALDFMKKDTSHKKEKKILIDNILQ